MVIRLRTPIVLFLNTFPYTQTWSLTSDQFSQFNYISGIGNYNDGQHCPDMPIYTDPRDGAVYNIMQIGNQCWPTFYYQSYVGVYNFPDAKRIITI